MLHPRSVVVVAKCTIFNDCVRNKNGNMKNGIKLLYMSHLVNPITEAAMEPSAVSKVIRISVRVIHNGFSG